jgi:iron(III) transport system permease protein
MLSQLRGFDFGGAAAYGMILIVLVALVFASGYRNVGGEGA